MNVGVLRSVERVDGVEDLNRFLGRCRRVEIDERSSIDLPVEDREVLAEVTEVGQVAGTPVR